MRLTEAITRGSIILNNSGIAGANFDAQLLMQYILNKDRAFLIREPFYELSVNEEKEYFNIISERALSKPVSYIIGEKEFMGLPFKVSEAVLIPRPDTEILTEEAIRILKNCISSDEYQQKTFDSPLRVLDMCTGSGAIAVSIGFYVEQVIITASDISEAALKIAEINAVRNGVGDRVNFVQSDLFEDISQNIMFDMIVSNPPYVKKAAIEDLMTDVKSFEPILALDGGDDGLDFYRSIIPEAVLRLKTGGYLLLETGHDQAASVSEILNSVDKFKEIRIIKDLTGFDRVISAIKI